MPVDVALAGARVAVVAGREVLVPEVAPAAVAGAEVVGAVDEPLAGFAVVAAFVPVEAAFGAAEPDAVFVAAVAAAPDVGFVVVAPVAFAGAAVDGGAGFDDNVAALVAGAAVAVAGAFVAATPAVPAFVAAGVAVFVVAAVAVFLAFALF